MIQRSLRRIHGVGTRLLYGSRHLVHGLLPPTAALTPAPLAPHTVLDGDPKPSVSLVARSADGGLRAGVWECTEGRFSWYFFCDELVYVLQGEATVVVNQRAEQLRPGTLTFFPIGTQSDWTVHERVRKLFVHRDPTPHISRMLDGRKREGA